MKKINCFINSNEFLLCDLKNKFSFDWRFFQWQFLFTFVSSNLFKFGSLQMIFRRNCKMCVLSLPAIRRDQIWWYPSTGKGGHRPQENGVERVFVQGFKLKIGRDRNEHLFISASIRSNRASCSHLKHSNVYVSDLNKLFVKQEKKSLARFEGED